MNLYSDFSDSDESCDIPYFHYATLARAVSNNIPIFANSNDSCVNTDLTLDQKLDINAQQNDHNNDGLVTSDDIAYDLNNRYDANSKCS